MKGNGYWFAKTLRVSTQLKLLTESPNKESNNILHKNYSHTVVLTFLGLRNLNLNSDDNLYLHDQNLYNKRNKHILVVIVCVNTMYIYIYIYIYIKVLFSGKFMI